MSKKYNWLLVALAVFACLFVFHAASAVANVTMTSKDMVTNIAVNPDSDMTQQEQIDSFDTSVAVNKDSTIRVTEKIAYNFGDQSKHGIFRDIPLSVVPGAFDKLSLTDISVVDEKGTPYTFTVSNDGFVHIKVGDADQLISGTHTYVIQYTGHNALGLFKDYDEIYWNATGNTWEFPIMHATARVVLPAVVDQTHLQIKSYCGSFGSQGACGPATTSVVGDHTEVFFTQSANTHFEAAEGMTVAVGFPKGLIAYPTTQDYLMQFIQRYWPYPAAVVLIMLWFRGSFLYWLRRRKFYQGTTVIPEYDAGDFTPVEAAAILDGEVTGQDLSAEIISLAIRGYLVIKEVDDEYSFVATGKDTSALNQEDKELLAGVSNQSQSDLKNEFYVTANKVCGSVVDALVLKNYLIKPSFVQKTSSKNLWPIKIFLGVFLAINPGAFIWAFAGMNVGLAFSSTCILIALISAFANPRKIKLTDTGLEAERALLGLKEYISVAEQDRIRFHDAPEKKPEVFEKLLPYAMIMGLEKEWAKQFENIYTVPPTWYSSNHMGAFSAIAFSSHMQDFSASTGSTLVSIPSSSGSSGSSGGGSSGGGGGGGGGGSW
jgi:uncharacterized membrane protein YgcG